MPFQIKSPGNASAKTRTVKACRIGERSVDTQLSQEGFGFDAAGDLCRTNGRSNHPGQLGGDIADRLRFLSKLYQRCA